MLKTNSLKTLRIYCRLYVQKALHNINDALLNHNTKAVHYDDDLDNKSDEEFGILLKNG